MEENILRHMATTTGLEPSIILSDPQTPDCNVIPFLSNVLWPNGDIVMTLNSMSTLVSQLPDSRSILAFNDEIAQSYDTERIPTISISPTIRPRRAHVDFSGPQSSQSERALSSPAPFQEIQQSQMTAEWISMRVRDYIVGIHSTSPILDLEYLRKLADLCMAGCVDYHTAKINLLPLDLQAADVAIFLLVLALGELTTLETPRDKHIGFNNCMELALPWLGFARFGSYIKELQSQLLLSSYFMWTLRHWDAWCVVEAMASKAEQVLLRFDEKFVQVFSFTIPFKLGRCS